LSALEPISSHGRAWPGHPRFAKLTAMRGGRVCILTNRRNGILYIGVARDLARRVCQHREGLGGTFTRRYGLKRLVWCEYHDKIMGAFSARKHSNIGRERGRCG
jgi:predicted GIY-YIG superfamily endonuclease